MSDESKISPESNTNPSTNSVDSSSSYGALNDEVLKPSLGEVDLINVHDNSTVKLTSLWNNNHPTTIVILLRHWL